MIPSIIREDPPQPEIQGLLDLADRYSAALYPAEGRHPMDITALAAPAVRFFVARDAGTAIGCCALVLGPDGTAELKRMIVRPSARGKGVGAALLRSIEAAAQAEAVHTLRLETGPLNREALSLYHRHGFTPRAAFGAYQPGPHSVFLEKPL